MTNWDLVFPYSEEAAGWLPEQGLPHPEVRGGNRLPTTAELQTALATLSPDPS